MPSRREEAVRGRSLSAALDGRSRDRGGKLRGGLVGRASESGDGSASVMICGLDVAGSRREKEGGEMRELGGVSNCSSRWEKSRLLSFKSC